MSKRTRLALALVALLPLGLSACSISPGDKVDLTMDDQSITISPPRVRAGRVRLAIDSVGEQQHDLALVIGNDLAALPRTPEGALDLKGANLPADELEPFAPGHYIALSPNLLAGHYLVICRLHVDQGHVGKLTVVARKRKVS